MKKIIGVATIAALGLTGGTAFARTFGDVAQVLSSTPVYSTEASPRQECWNEPVSTYEHRRTYRDGPEYTRADNRGGIGAGTVLGAIIGGVVGHQFGGTSGARDKATGAGAIIGGLIGNSVDNDSGYRTASRDVYEERVPVTRDVRRCKTVTDTEQRVVGYDVRYQYNGREFTTRLPYDPGPTMPVNVDVRPPTPRAPNYR